MQVEKGAVEGYDSLSDVISIMVLSPSAVVFLKTVGDKERVHRGDKSLSFRLS